MKKYYNNTRLLWVLLMIGFIIVFATLWQINVIINSLREGEQKQVEIWAKAISRKAEIVKQTQEFYGATLEEENRKMQQFIEAYKIILSQDDDADLTSPKLKFYTKILMDNKTIPVVVTDEFNNIQFSQNVDLKDQKVLVGDLYKQFSQHKPWEYEVYGMKFRLYYKESEIYASLKSVMDEVIHSFLTEVTENTVSVPIIITNKEKTKILAYGNLDSNLVSKENVQNTLKEMASDNNPIEISLPLKQNGYIFYQKSANITILKYYPYLYMFVFVLFGVLMFQVFRAMKISEQNSVWIGMSKETAHQLGTPISSLMAWIELLKTNPENIETCKEMNKDVQRLNVVSQRFSQIGSNTVLEKQDITKTVKDMIDYISLRSPKKISFIDEIPNDMQVLIPYNRFLIEWTFENLFKNAIDAMEGDGTITVSMQTTDKKVYIDVSDTGKGIPKASFKKIFQPGFTTKKRGWGLGLSLVRRIVEEYHKGRIYVKSSVLNVGTTFRIELNKEKK